MTTTQTECPHKWVSYQYADQLQPSYTCDLCGVDKSDLPEPVAVATIAPIPAVSVQPVLERGYGT